MNARRSPAGSRHIGELQASHQRDEFRIALRALLMQPLMSPIHEDFPAVRRQADRLREWFLREAGWMLNVERDGARLYKRPANLRDATRGLKDYDKRRYVLLCLACAVLERAEPQITLNLLGQRVMQMAIDPPLASRKFEFTLRSAAERRELVVVCRSLLELGVLQRVAGDEESFVHDNRGAQADALYDIQRRMLAGMLAAVRGPSTWATADAPLDLEDRLRAMVTEHVGDDEEGRRTALRHALSRRLLDDPVIYADSLDEDAHAYFVNQRGAMADRLCRATGLTPEQRAEGLALTDEAGTLTDVSMPAEGTEAHATLLVAEHLAAQLRTGASSSALTEKAVAAFLGAATERYGRFWRKSAREPGAEHELAQTALDRLEKLQLVVREPSRIRPLPAISRFALGDAEVQPVQARQQPASSLF
ncbi:TIGR02678 family protein [Variovorax sp. PDC80]|uniref:TIGR02678 family protein n=1 Tax=Variovorax sp. PDC80 TaxID=1882827 RepID=UPI0008E781FF|nr:TIGR02678 family protein [Variovorax sp. PDC80]SFO32200.1 TIGR02678 family protein [Variovorax sp. PDC80]